MARIKKYCPSNGVDGDCFMAKWCDRCANEKGCEIKIRTMVTNFYDPEYPSEWRWLRGKPVCTAYEVRESVDFKRYAQMSLFN